MRADLITKDPDIVITMTESEAIHIARCVSNGMRMRAKDSHIEYDERIVKAFHEMITYLIAFKH